jgi:hypothetical protein
VAQCRDQIEGRETGVGNDDKATIGQPTLDLAYCLTRQIGQLLMPPAVLAAPALGGREDRQKWQGPAPSRPRYRYHDRRGAEVLTSTIQGIRLRHGVKAVWRRRPRVPSWLTIAEVTSRLGVPLDRVHGRIRHGDIETRREPTGRYLFPYSEQTMQAIRQLRAGKIKHIDLTPRHDQTEVLP